MLPAFVVVPLVVQVQVVLELAFSDNNYYCLDA